MENTNTTNNSADNQFSIQDNFTEAEAAKWLKVSRITLQRARLRGEITFSRIGGCRVIYTLRHLRDYLTSREYAAYLPARKRK